jgi:hypothetical protein
MADPEDCMSDDVFPKSKKKKHVRDVLDRFYTPDPVAVACVSVLPELRPTLVIEPSVGGGAYARAIRARWPDTLIHGVDLDPNAPGKADTTFFVTGNWVELATDFARDKPDLVAGNPPYKGALVHVQRSLAVAPVVGLLLRLGFLASQGRRSFWRAHPPAYVHILSRRPSFTDGGTDNSDYAFYVWDEREGPATSTRLHWLDWSKE